GQTELHERDQALASREHLALSTGARQELNRVGNVARDRVLEGCRDHVRLPKNPLQTSGLYTRTTLQERDRMPVQLADDDLDVHALIPERADGDDIRAHVDAIRARRDTFDLEGERRDLVRCDDLLALDR